MLYASTLKNVHVPLNQNLLQEDDSLAQIKMSRFTAVMPIIVPVLLIIGQTATDVFMPGTTLAEVMSFIGALLSVLIIGCLLAVFTQIKGWWKRYGVTLFTRKPHLRLTYEGKTMLRYLTRIRALEGDMENELADVSGGVRGTLRLGLPTTRGSILLPQTVTQFRRQFPNVEVEGAACRHAESGSSAARRDTRPLSRRGHFAARSVPARAAVP